MSGEQRKAYKDMFNDYLAYVNTLENSENPPAIVASMAAVKALRLQQIVSGFANLDNKTVHRFKDCPRLDSLGEMLDDLCPQGKIIVWACFKENYKMIAELCQKKGIAYREIHGDINDREKQSNMNDFRGDETVRVMIANQSAGGVGINLVEARYSVYYSKSFKLEDDLQSEKRNHRQGSQMHDKITRYDLCCPGTIDELVNDALSAKLSVSDRILGWKKDMCKF